MLKGLTTAGLGKIGPTERFIELAAQHGFQAVDIDAKSFLEQKGAEEAKSILRRNGIVIGSVGLPVQWRTSDEEFRKGLARLADYAAAAAELGASRCCTYILPSVDENPAHFMALATYRLRTCAQILHAYGIQLGLEFVGPHHLRTKWKHPFIWTMDQTLDWIDAIGMPNVGLLLDAYHWYTTESTVEDLLRLSPSQIVHVHINDAPNVPIEDVLDNDRLITGEGVIDLVSFVRALHQIGYRGVVSQEVLRPAPPEEPAEELLRRSQAGFEKVFSAALG